MGALGQEDTRSYPARGCHGAWGGSKRRWGGHEDGVKDDSLLPREWLCLGAAWAQCWTAFTEAGAFHKQERECADCLSHARCPPQFAAPRQSRSPGEAATDSPLVPQHHLLTRRGCARRGNFRLRLNLALEVGGRDTQNPVSLPPGVNGRHSPPPHPLGAPRTGPHACLWGETLCLSAGTGPEVCPASAALPDSS